MSSFTWKLLPCLPGAEWFSAAVTTWLTSPTSLQMGHGVNRSHLGFPVCPKHDREPSFGMMVTRLAWPIIRSRSSQALASLLRFISWNRCHGVKHSSPIGQFITWRSSENSLRFQHSRLHHDCSHSKPFISSNTIHVKPPTPPAKPPTVLT